MIGDTGVRAGILKCATDKPGITPGVERVLRAVAKAHRATGVPITTHTPTPPQPWGLEQQRILAEEGVDLSRVVIGHSGGTLDTAYHEALLANGSYLGFDHFGIGTFSMAERIESVKVLCDRGHADRIVLSHDAMCHVDWFPASMAGAWKEWRWTHIPQDVLPEMRRIGHRGRGHQHDDGGQSAPDPRRRRAVLTGGPADRADPGDRTPGLAPHGGGRDSDAIEAMAESHPDAVAWRNLADGSDLTFLDWNSRANQLTRGLLERGLDPGGRVILAVGPDEPLPWLIAYAAIHRSGAVAVPVNTRLAPPELRAIVAHAEPSVVLAGRDVDIGISLDGLTDEAPTIRVVASTGSPDAPGRGPCSCAVVLSRDRESAWQRRRSPPRRSADDHGGGGAYCRHRLYHRAPEIPIGVGTHFSLDLRCSACAACPSCRECSISDAAMASASRTSTLALPSIRLATLLEGIRPTPVPWGSLGLSSTDVAARRATCDAPITLGTWARSGSIGRRMSPGFWRLCRPAG